MDTSILEDIGLTNAEIKVYLALLELGESTAGPILEKSGLQNSVVHMTLRKLAEKGFISFIKRGRVKVYTPSDPKHVLSFIDEKRKRYEQLLPELLLRQKKVEPQEAEVFEGFRGLKNMLHRMIEDAQHGDEFLFFSFYTKNPDDFDNVYNYYREFEAERLRRGIHTRGIAPKSIRGKLANRPTINLRYASFPVLVNISVFRNKVIFTPWEDRQVSFLVHSRQLADSFRQYFEMMWEQCAP